MGESILKPGRNCWRIRRAERVAFLIDGATYFDALRQALHSARDQVVVLAWDIYSRLKLQGEEVSRKAPELGELLNHLVDQRPDLQIHVLSWDFSMLFAMDREWVSGYRLTWKTHRRLRFEMDDGCPTGASFHQKVVVIDDALAFCGGLDLTRGRWDTPEHRPHDPRRKKVDGTRGRPYHDVQMGVTGPAAAALGDLARERWRRATGEQLPRPETAPGGARDGNGIPFDVADVDVAIVRTEPAMDGRDEVREVERLYLDSIAAARECIYVENQYFTCGAVARAMRERLREARGPEIVLILPLRTEGWLANNSMDAIRVHLIEQLRAADAHGRFAVYYPEHPDAGDQPINLHAKVMVVDDRLVRVGSSNLNNRSMGLDAECDLAIEARDDQDGIREAIRRFRRRLVGEHLNVSPDQVDRALDERDGSLIGAIEVLRGSGRTLEPLEPVLRKVDYPVLTDVELVDPERPIDPDALLRYFVPESGSRPAGLRLLGWVVALLALSGLAAAWRFTPLSEWLHPSQLGSTIAEIRGWPGTPVVLVGTFVVGGFLLVPLTALIIGTVVAFGPFLGFLYALLGALASALASYGVGAQIGRRPVLRLAGRRVSEISRRLAKRGLLTVMVVRVVPVAPFTVVNLIAGASHIRFRDFLAGTFLGMTPGIMAIVLLVDRVSASIRAPSPANILTLIAVAVGVVLAAFVLSRKLLRQTERPAGGERPGD
ncbi:MAG: VTT domain-containing protein [Nitrospirota bacterium]